MAQETINATFAGRLLNSQPTTNLTDILEAGEETGSSNITRGFLKLPFTNIPSNSIFTSVVLKIYLLNNFASNTRTLRVFRCKQVLTSGATWNKYDGTNDWATAGAGNTTTDREATDIGSLSIDAAETTGVYLSITLTASEVQEMFDGSFTNNGLILVMDTETDDAHSFEAVGGSNPPQWVINYTTAYTRGDEAVLPSDDTDLENVYTDQDVTDVATADDTRVAQTATNQYMIHQFKNDIGAAGACNLLWEGQTSWPPSSNTVVLQIYNRDTTTWETVDSDNSSSEDTDFTLNANIPDTTDYVDANGYISCRVYQQATF